MYRSTAHWRSAALLVLDDHPMMPEPAPDACSAAGPDSFATSRFG
jgi:hypothetical protein